VRLSGGGAGVSLTQCPPGVGRELNSVRMGWFRELSGGVQVSLFVGRNGAPK
jgi:hypothetical protein